MIPNKPHIDWYIFFSTITLMLFSIAFVYSAGIYFSQLNGMDSTNLLLAQTIKVMIAIIILIVVSRFNYKYWAKFSILLMLISFISLILVLVMGVEVGGAKRWISLGFTQFQPSELAKFSLILHFGTLISRKKEEIKNFKYGYFPFILWLALFSVLIALEPNFSMIILLFGIGIFMLYIGNASMKHILSTIGVVGLIGSVYALSATYRINRIKYFLGLLDGNEFEKLSYQVENSLLAIGSGGLFGLGPGGSHQNLMLSEPYTDFLFSIIGEEYGFIGLTIIAIAFSIILWRGLYLAKRAPDQEAFLFISGISFAIFVSFLINSFVNTALIPTTGIPLPFLSYGGTAIFFNAAMIGIVLNVSIQVSKNSKTTTSNAKPNPTKIQT